MKPASNEPRINQLIREKEVRLVGVEGEMLGVVPVEKALAMAEDAGVDLVEVSPGAAPPVCKLMDYGKYKYELQKKANEARKKQKVVNIKEIKMRITIDPHDLDVKMRKIEQFLEDGDKVKITIRFRGREGSHVEKIAELIERIKTRLAPVAKFEQEPRREGQFLGMMLAPAK